MSSEEQDERDQLQSLIADVLEAESRGESVDRKALIESHPEIADSLGEFFASYDQRTSAADLVPPTLPPRARQASEDPTIPLGPSPIDDATLPATAPSAAMIAGENRKRVGRPLHELFEAVITAENRGERIDRDALISENPAYADALTGFFARNDLDSSSAADPNAEIDDALLVHDDHGLKNGLVDARRTAHHEASVATQPAANLNATTGLCIASVGLVGWIVTAIVMATLGYEPKTGDGQRDFIIGIENLFTFVMRVATGLVATMLFGFCSGTGLIISLLGLAQQPTRVARAGAIVSGLGIAIGAVLIGGRILR